MKDSRVAARKETRAEAKRKNESGAEMNAKSGKKCDADNQGKNEPNIFRTRADRKDVSKLGN